MRVLQDILADLPFTDLPPAWQDHDLATFSTAKHLWEYQQEALQYALKALWKYYEDFQDFAEAEPETANEKRKEHLWQWYRDNGLEENLDIPLGRQKRDIRALLEAYYLPEDGRIPYRHFINRMGFWMATGSGKSLVLIRYWSSPPVMICSINSKPMWKSSMKAAQIFASIWKISRPIPSACGCSSLS